MIHQQRGVSMNQGNETGVVARFLEPPVGFEPTTC